MNLNVFVKADGLAKSCNTGHLPTRQQPVTQRVGVGCAFFAQPTPTSIPIS
jgi:hypothetical protein